MSCVPLSNRQILVHVYCGGKAATQISPFTVAVQNIKSLLKSEFSNVDIVLVYMFSKDLRPVDWTPDDLVSWLKSSDYHFILTHVHQGLDFWNCADVVRALLRLERHPGFPYGKELSCPIFLQDKQKYIEGNHKTSFAKTSD
jgi:hypothetical protein